MLNHGQYRGLVFSGRVKASVCENGAPGLTQQNAGLSCLPHPPGITQSSAGQQSALSPLPHGMSVVLGPARMVSKGHETVTYAATNGKGSNSVRRTT